MATLNRAVSIVQSDNSEAGKTKVHRLDGQSMGFRGTVITQKGPGPPFQLSKSPTLHLLGAMAKLTSSDQSFPSKFCINPGYMSQVWTRFIAQIITERKKVPDLASTTQNTIYDVNYQSERTIEQVIRCRRWLSPVVHMFYLAHLFVFFPDTHLRMPISRPTNVSYPRLTAKRCIEITKWYRKKKGLPLDSWLPAIDVFWKFDQQSVHVKAFAFS
ncbi:LADA_0A01640g1_1 [Lachancea dasiensis]|uniref:LADA_0A01640g1_1 n=1 Tax=Lachancea dasiensis TaxID=1072105 RepID=A0A1G4IM23_9SACH|nr:LADA_0A01640g1_1 [Lachancea dasiensis]